MRKAGDCDLWDGVNLLLLERVMSLVNTAHELEPSIPRLNPIALRTYFHTAPKTRPTPQPADGLSLILIGANPALIKTAYSSL